MHNTAVDVLRNVSRSTQAVARAEHTIAAHCNVGTATSLLAVRPKHGRRGTVATFPRAVDESNVGQSKLTRLGLVAQRTPLRFVNACPAVWIRSTKRRGTSFAMTCAGDTIIWWVQCARRVTRDRGITEGPEELVIRAAGARVISNRSCISIAMQKIATREFVAVRSVIDLSSGAGGATLAKPAKVKHGVVTQPVDTAAPLIAIGAPHVCLNALVAVFSADYQGSEALATGTRSHVQFAFRPVASDELITRLTCVRRIRTRLFAEACAMDSSIWFAISAVDRPVASRAKILSVVHAAAASTRIECRLRIHKSSCQVARGGLLAIGSTKPSLATRAVTIAGGSVAGRSLIWHARHSQVANGTTPTSIATIAKPVASLTAAGNAVLAAACYTVCARGAAIISLATVTAHDWRWVVGRFSCSYPDI